MSIQRNSARNRWGRMLLLSGAAATTPALFYPGTGLTDPWLTWLAPLPALLIVPRVSLPAAIAAAFTGYLVGLAGYGRYMLGALSVPVRRADHQPVHCASKKIKILLGSAGHQELIRCKQGKQCARSVEASRVQRPAELRLTASKIDQTMACAASIRRNRRGIPTQPSPSGSSVTVGHRLAPGWLAFRRWIGGSLLDSELGRGICL